MSERGLCFECTRCGLCCTNRGEYAHVYVGREEIRAIARLLGLSPREFERRYTFIDEDGWRQLAFEKDACFFLDPETRGCRIYPARPIQCRTFPFWRDFVRDGQWTQEVRDLCEGIGRGPVHREEEVEACMVEMEQSESSEPD
ncbi:MAG: YkgJ family cysteine cluster protein [Myxococcota bacterium]